MREVYDFNEFQHPSSLNNHTYKDKQRPKEVIVFSEPTIPVANKIQDNQYSPEPVERRARKSTEILGEEEILELLSYYSQNRYAKENTIEEPEIKLITPPVQTKLVHKKNIAILKNAPQAKVSLLKKVNYDFLAIKFYIKTMVLFYVRYHFRKLFTAISEPIVEFKKFVRQIIEDAVHGMAVIPFIILAVIIIPSIGVPRFSATKAHLPTTINMEQVKSSLAKVKSILPTVKSENTFKSISPQYVELKNNIAVERPVLIRNTLGCDISKIENAIKNGEDINSVDANGDTALSWAAKLNCIEAAKFLIKNGANINSISHNGFTPHDWAKWYGNYNLKLILEQAGAVSRVG